ncbi:thiamine pyrophosphate-dependent enzyme [Propionivibrio dicarboxylicus]|uniref:Indolepyruvate oxidoreductase subunit IorA n=1 Tax=Propionivibrio dicarboxylicus TaxID=83767 RepID=A0A1G8M654_9RHOO|nr:thiamine pyrophosphate-dependent enzyme [Propionivibrio dicarboxylicus]SDI63401.1 indolepyruvate ferredoxin oxidoreductase alpha subunit [Propionivibrio dicarboxylicus]
MVAKLADRMLLSGDEAVALAAFNAGVLLGTGYPGTPSTEILEAFAALGGKAQWAPNEKVALEVGIGVAFAGGRSLVTMKHVGVNVAADALFTAAYTGVTGGLVLVSADDPGMASSQNEQDNRHYARAAGLLMLEPADSQQAYDFAAAAFALSEQFRQPVLLRMTTRTCHSKSIVTQTALPGPAQAPSFERNIPARVMIPAYARPAHHALRDKLARAAAYAENCAQTIVEPRSKALGIIASGVAAMHAREVAPEASLLQLGFSYPLPMQAIRDFVASVERCVVIEEGDRILVTELRAEGLAVEGKPERFRFGELNADRVRRILEHDDSPEAKIPGGKPPALCEGCSHRPVFEALNRLDCIVSGDIGCYSLGVLPPFTAMDTLVCMGASIGVGLGMRHVLPPEQAKRVVSVIGDSTFVHSGLTGLAEMVYNPPPTGHVVLIVDNGTTAMTGQQEHPGTGRTLLHDATGRLLFEDIARAMGIADVITVDPMASDVVLDDVLRQALDSGRLVVIVARRPCILAAPKIRQYERAAAEKRIGIAVRVDG